MCHPAHVLLRNMLGLCMLHAYISDSASIGGHLRRDAGVVELARLESVCTGNRTVGSNPTLSAH
jgi:hypothetical protein